MKRNTGFRVRKHDGRTEWLRTSKLARSIRLAILAGRPEHENTLAGVLTGEEWRHADLTAAVITGLRSCHGADSVVPTSRIADAVQQVLLATGFPRAAADYGRVGAEQARRRSMLRRSMPSVQDGIPLAASQPVHPSRRNPAGGRSAGGPSSGDPASRGRSV